MARKSKKKQETVLENVIEKYLKDELQKAGGICWKWNSSSLIGVPDRICMLNSNVVFVELKRPGGKPRDSQIDVHKRMALRGIGTLVIDTKEGVDILVKEMKKNKGNGGW